MNAVGETLRRERLRQGLTLEQISRETKISARLLDAIEKERFDLLPGGVFAKSFARQYARFLGLDEQELGAEVEKVVAPVTELPSFNAAPPEPAFKVPPVVEWEGAGRSNSSVLPALALVVAVMLVCSAVFAWWQRGRGSSAPAPPVHTARKTPASAVPLAAPATSEPSRMPPARTAEEPPRTEIAQATTLGSADPGAALHVSMTADSDAWVQAWADGKSVSVGILPPNVVKTVAAVDAIRIRTGNAGSLQVTVNGKPAGPLGPKGQVRTLEVTRDGVQILPPPPKPAPAAPEPL